MTHHAVGFSMPRDNQPPNRTACHLASQVVRVREEQLMIPLAETKCW
jgi:hypothetical protein